MLADPWSRYSLLFPLLVLRCAIRTDPTAHTHRGGYLLIAISLGITFIGAIGGVEFIRFARLAIPCGILGLAWIFGRPSWKIALLSLWIIPIPHAVLEVASPILEVYLLRTAAFIPSIFDPAITVQGTIFHAPSGSLEVANTESGILLLALFSGLGWYSGISRRLDAKGCIRRSFYSGLMAMPVQWLALVFATLFIYFQHATLAKLCLVPWLFVWTSFGAIILIEYNARKSAHI